jgi:hypothetical protein
MGRVWAGILLIFFLGNCEQGAENEAATYLFVEEYSSRHDLFFGDVLRVAGGGAQVQSLKEATIGPPRSIPTADVEGLLRSDSVVRLLPVKAVLRPEDITRSPFGYRLGAYDFWASFEAYFTGFPEYVRPGSRDFVNRMENWDSLTPGLAYTEYVFLEDLPQSVILIAERQGSDYLDNWGVVVDTVTAEGFGGTVVGRPDEIEGARGERIFFRRQASPLAGYNADSFTQEVNTGFSRSSLLFPPRDLDDISLTQGSKRLPRRATIDRGDLGNISASFLDGSRFMLLSDDHLILEGNYALDLDKGLLSVEDKAGLVYRLFLKETGGIAITLPVWVLQLEGSRLAGTDNYLRVEVVP